MWYIVWYNHATAYPMYTNTAKPYFYTSYKLHSASYSNWYSIYWWTNDCSYSVIEEVQIVKMVPTFCVKMFLMKSRSRSYAWDIQSLENRCKHVQRPRNVCVWKNTRSKLRVNTIALQWNVPWKLVFLLAHVVSGKKSIMHAIVAHGERSVNTTTLANFLVTVLCMHFWITQKVGTF